MTVERNHAVALVMVLVGFLIGSKSDELLLSQLETRQVIILTSEKKKKKKKKTSVILVLICVSLCLFAFSK